MLTGYQEMIEDLYAQSKKYCAEKDSRDHQRRREAVSRNNVDMDAAADADDEPEPSTMAGAPYKYSLLINKQNARELDAYSRDRDPYSSIGAQSAYEGYPA